MSARLQVLNIPLSNDGETVNGVIIQGEFPMTEVEWAQFQKVLRKMKPALVDPDPVPD